eukprot:g3030.t1
MLDMQSVLFGFKCIVEKFPCNIAEALSSFLKICLNNQISIAFAKYLFNSTAMFIGYKSTHNMIVDYLDEILGIYIDLSDVNCLDALLKFPAFIVFDGRLIPNISSFLQRFQGEIISCLIVKGAANASKMDIELDNENHTSKDRTLLSNLEKNRLKLLKVLARQCSVRDSNNIFERNDDITAGSEDEVNAIINRSMDFVLCKIYQNRYIIPSFSKDKRKCTECKNIANKSELLLMQAFGGERSYKTVLGKSFKAYVPWLLINSFVGDEELTEFGDITNDNKTGERAVNMLQMKSQLFEEYLSNLVEDKSVIIAQINVESLSSFILLSFAQSRSKKKIYNAAIALYIFTNIFKSSLATQNVSNNTLRNISAIAWLLMHKDYDQNGSLIWFICVYTISLFVKYISKAQVDHFKTNSIHYMRVLLLPLLHNLKTDVPLNQVKSTNLKETILTKKLKRLSHAGICILLRRIPVGLKEQLLCTFKDIADLNDLALNMYQNIAHYPIYSNTIVQGYLEELKWIKHFSLNYGHGGTMRYQYLILKSLLNQIENTAGVTVSSPMTLDNMEILWRFEGSTANNTSATTKIETAVGQLIQNLIVL